MKITAQHISILEEKMMSNAGWVHKQNQDIVGITFQHKSLYRDIIH